MTARLSSRLRRAFAFACLGLLGAAAASLAADPKVLNVYNLSLIHI